MFKALGHWLNQIFGSSQPDQPRVASLQQAESNSQMAEQFDSIDAASHLVPYDENLLERARTQWQFGDWNSLAKLDRDTLQHHPDRAKLALLAAAGLLQIGQDSEARQYIRLAQDWGCSKKQISQVLISGVHNTIGMAAAIGGQQQRSALHFEKAISVGSPSSDIQLLTQARSAHQVSQFLQIGSLDKVLFVRDRDRNHTQEHADKLLEAKGQALAQAHQQCDRLIKVETELQKNLEQALSTVDKVTNQLHESNKQKEELTKRHKKIELEIQRSVDQIDLLKNILQPGANR